MKQIYLGGRHGSLIGNYALVDDADYDWLNQWKWTAKKSGNTFYAERGIGIKGTRKVVCIKMHRMVLGLISPKDYGDHVDGNGLNNQRANIRKCSAKENTRNRRPYTGRTSKYKGVSCCPPGRKWVAKIGYNNKELRLGSFLSETDAALAYNEAAIKYHGEFAVINIINQ